MIYDCFTFFNELELLEIRLNTLNKVVDKFVIVEATRTQNNQKKPLYYELNKERYNKFASKIIHIVVEKFPKKIDQWTIENFQRNQIKKGLTRCKNNDIILISDLDEIVTPSVLIKATKTLKKGEITVFNLNTTFLYLNLFAPNLIHDNRCKMLFYKDFKTLLNDTKVIHPACQLNLNRKTTATKIRIYEGYRQRFIENAGWHFTWLGNNSRILTKLKSVCEGEKQATLKNAELFRRRLIKKLKPIYLNQYFPVFLRENRSKYEHLLIKPKYKFSPLMVKIYKVRLLSFKVLLRVINCFIPSKKIRKKVRAYGNPANVLKFQ